jgi:hypothetical protein
LVASNGDLRDVRIISDGELCLSVPSRFVRSARSSVAPCLETPSGDDVFRHGGFVDLDFRGGHAKGLGEFKPWGENTSLLRDFAPSLQNDPSMQPVQICPPPRAADTYGSSVFPTVDYSGGPMLPGGKGELKRGADELVVHYFEFTDASGVVRRAYATGSLHGEVLNACLLLSRRELRGEYLPRLSPELRKVVMKARHTLTQTPTAA